MKKTICTLVCFVCILGFSLSVLSAEVLHYAFEEDSLTTVTNTLKNGGSPAFAEGVEGKGLLMNKSYGVKLGYVGNTFTVSAMVRLTSTGETDTIFFKDMDNVGNKWTGVISNGLKPAFWTHGTNHRWETVANGDMDLSNWSYITYVENNAVGSLYVNGELVGSGAVESGSGNLYLGATYWSADAISGVVDEVKLYNTALSASEVMSAYEQYVDFENAIKLPKEVISDVSLPKMIASKSVHWESDDEKIISATGAVTRYAEDKTVTLRALIDGKVIGEFEITVLKVPVNVNKKVLIQYDFDKNDGEIIHDKSGNGNHGAAYGQLKIGENGAIFDGNDDYIQMPEGVLYGNDEITIITTFKPEAAQKHVFLYGFGNGTDTGYMFLNPSRPSTNTIRFAITKTNFSNEKDIASVPGIRIGEEVTVCVTVSGKYASMYINGDLVMDGAIDIEISDLGKTLKNYIGKSLYDQDPYFKGEIAEFKVLGYCMSEAEIKEEYGISPEYAPIVEKGEYITAVSFENGVEVEIDNKGRDDVKIAALVLDENNSVIDFIVGESSDELKLEKEGTIIVFAFDEENNIPGNLYVKGQGEGFKYEYVPGKVVVTPFSEKTNGMVIVAGYDTIGTLTGVSFKICDMENGVPVEISGDFKNAVRFKMFYWTNLVAMVPAAG